MQAAVALVLDRVTKKYGDFTAVDDLSFAVRAGEVFGFLGGNGAGKTTSLRMVLDIIRPTSGSIAVLGRAPGRENAPFLGFLPEERGLYRTMSAIDTIVYFGRLKGMTPGDARTEGLALLDRFGLSANTKSTVGQLSKGMAQKVQLATAVVNSPQLLILDEPFSGLDPGQPGPARGRDPPRVGQGRDRGLLDPRHAACRAPVRPAAAARPRRQEVRRHARRGPRAASRAAGRHRAPIAGRRARCRRLPGAGRGGAAAGRTMRVTLRPGASAGDLLEHCSSNGVALRRFEERRASLHDVFLHMVGSEESARVNNILLVAIREFRQITRMRSFWLTLLILPLAISIAPLTQRFMGESEADRVMIIDQDGGVAGREIAGRLRLEEDRRSLDALARYVQRHKIAAPAAAPWARNDRYFTDAEVARVRGRGRRRRPRWSASSPRFPRTRPSSQPPDPRYELVDPAARPRRPHRQRARPAAGNAASPGSGKQGRSARRGDHHPGRLPAHRQPRNSLPRAGPIRSSSGPSRKC